jgi:hypothetical protein
MNPRFALGLVAGMLGLASAVSAEPSITILPLGFEVREFRGPASRAAAVAPSIGPLRSDPTLRDRPMVVVWGEQNGAALSLVGRELRIAPLGPSFGDLALAERGRDTIPASRVESAGALTASLTGPTRDYPHEALGGRTHAKQVSVSERKPVPIGAGAQTVPMEVSRVDAGPGAVFEDREPRLVDLGRGGPPDIVTVKSYAGQGSALVVIGRRRGVWRVVSETPPIGTAQRWLNPAGVADFLGTGDKQIALVRMPHLEGVLQLWALEGDDLKLKAEKTGYANHAYGLAAQDMAAVVDVEGDGQPELAVPTLDRRALAVVSFKGGIREIARVPLPGAAATGVAALGSGRDLHLLVGLEDGRVAHVRL